jgi:Fe-S cluster assembly protein SufD
VAEKVLETDLFSREAVLALSERYGEPDWLRARREEAWRLYLDTPFPNSNTDEKWRRDDISRFVRRLDTFKPGEEPSPTTLEELPAPIQAILRESDKRGGLIVRRDAGVAYAELDEEYAEQGVIFTDLSTALREHSDLVEQFLFKAVKIDEGKFPSMHAALMNGGVFLYVPKGVTVERSFQVVHWLDNTNIAVFPHTLLVLAESAAATVVEEYISPDLEGIALVNGATELLIGANAVLTYLGIQNWGKNVWHFATQRSLVEANGVLNFSNGQLGSRFNRFETEAWMEGTGSTAYLQGIFFTGNTQHISNHTLQFHRNTQTTSDLLYKGGLTGKSRSVYEGLIKVARGAQQTDAYQANRNLMLSKKAHADSIPQLEIEANDVRCTHGSTTSQLDEEELFYLMSRGIRRDDAVRVIVEGFFAPVLDRIPLREVRRRLKSAVTAKLEL